jgi:hypothetical protein
VVGGESIGQERAVIYGRGCQTDACQVFDESSRNSAWSSEVSRKQTRARAYLCLTMDIERSLVVRLQGLSLPSPFCPSHLGAQTLERKREG